MTYIPSLVCFGVCSGSKKCDHFGHRIIIIISITIGTSQGTCDGPNNHYDYNRDPCHRLCSLFLWTEFLGAAKGLEGPVLERLAAEYEAAGMRICTSKSEAMLLDRKKVACSLRVGGELLPQVEELKYLGVLFTFESHLAKNFIIYCRPEFPPLGGTVIKESTFRLCRTFKPYIHTFSELC